MTPETAAAMAGALRGGASLEEAAVRAGVSERTFQDWRRRARAVPDGPHGRFMASVDEARGAMPDGPPVAGEDELLRLLTARARRGSVPAMTALLNHYERRRKAAKDGDSGKPADPFEATDELAGRRARRAA